MILAYIQSIEDDNKRRIVEDIYDLYYKHMKTHQYWKDKVRQTLTINPKHFRCTERGKWMLIKKGE